MKPKVGLKFLHARVLDEQNRPMAFVVTRIANGSVYYRPADGGGGGQTCGVGEFPRWVKKEPAR
jgi:hypothetical protein